MSNKNGNGEGTITRRADGRWEARITLPDGGRKCFYGKTRRDVDRKLAEARRSVESGLPLMDGRQTVEQFLLSWLETMVHVVRPRTWQRYKEFVHLHILPAVGKVVLSKLTPQQVQRFYAQRLDAGYSPTTVNHIHAMLHRALKNAVRLSVVQRNVTEMVDAPRMAHHEMKALTLTQARAFLAAAEGDRFYALYVLAITTGMRQGELLALRWEDIDFEQGVAQVRATLQFLDGHFVFSEPKTSYSRRRVALTKNALEALRHHKVMQVQEQLALGDAWDGVYDLVFTNTIGKPITATNLISREFRPMLKKAEVPLVRFHDLRHTAATLLLLRGINPKIVSVMLGHSHVGITLDVYSHVTLDMQNVAVNAMESLLGE